MAESTRQAELEAQGWEARFIADEPRLSESVELYESLGMEVHLEPVRADSAACTTCMENCRDHYMMIYTRQRAEGGEARGLSDLNPEGR